MLPRTLARWTGALDRRVGPARWTGALDRRVGPALDRNRQRKGESLFRIGPPAAHAEARRRQFCTHAFAPELGRHLSTHLFSRYERHRQVEGGDLDDLLDTRAQRSEEHTSELQSRPHLVCRLLLEKKKR